MLLQIVLRGLQLCLLVPISIISKGELGKEKVRRGEEIASVQTNKKNI